MTRGTSRTYRSTMDWETLASGYGLVEGPTVDDAGGLYFSDVLGGGVYRLDANGDVETVVPKRRGIGGLALHANGGVVCSGRDIVHVHDGKTRVLLSVDGVSGWNDLCTDERGRVYAGALRFAVFDRDADEIPGEAWRVDGEGDGIAIYDGVIHANGIALSPDECTIFHSDTRAHRVLVHDLDDDGVVTAARAIDTSEYGDPDGLAVDETGCVWAAILGGFGIARLTPDGRLDSRVDVPATFVTSLCFGGDDRRDLYVTTADNVDDAARRGTVLRGRVDVAGAPVHPARI
jgi:D-xylonolactonase